MEFTFDFAKINQDVKRVLASPRKFFSTDIDRNWKESFSYYLILSAIGNILIILYLMFLYPVLIKYIPFLAAEDPLDNSFMGLLPFALSSFVVGIGFSFLGALAIIAWAKLFDIKTDLNQAYKIFVYSRTPNYLLRWVPFVNLLAFVYSLYLIYVAVKNTYKVSNNRALAFVTTAVIALIALSSAIGLLIKAF